MTATEALNFVWCGDFTSSLDVEDAFKALAAEMDRLRADQADWRKGVGLISSALGEPEPRNLSCVRLSETVLALRVGAERLELRVEELEAVLGAIVTAASRKPNMDGSIQPRDWAQQMVPTELIEAGEAILRREESNG